MPLRDGFRYHRYEWYNQSFAWQFECREPNGSSANENRKQLC